MAIGPEDEAVMKVGRAIGKTRAAFLERGKDIDPIVDDSHKVAERILAEQNNARTSLAYILGGIQGHADVLKPEENRRSEIEEEVRLIKEALDSLPIARNFNHEQLVQTSANSTIQEVQEDSKHKSSDDSIEHTISEENKNPPPLYDKTCRQVFRFRKKKESDMEQVDNKSYGHMTAYKPISFQTGSLKSLRNASKSRRGMSSKALNDMFDEVSTGDGKDKQKVIPIDSKDKEKDAKLAEKGDNKAELKKAAKKAG